VKDAAYFDAVEAAGAVYSWHSAIGRQRNGSSAIQRALEALQLVQQSMQPSSSSRPAVTAREDSSSAPKEAMKADEGPQKKKAKVI